MLSEEVVTELVEGSREVLGDDLFSVVLYGSAARGEDGSESDVDIALLVNRQLTREERSRLYAFFSELWMKTDLFFSPIDIEKSTFESWLDILPLYRNIQKEGVVLWTAA